MRQFIILTIGLLIICCTTNARSRSLADSCLHILKTNSSLSSLEKCDLLLTTIHNINYEDSFISLTNLLIKEAEKSGSYYHLFYGYYEQGQYNIIHAANNQEGLELLLKSLEIAKTNQLTPEEGFASFTIGGAFYQIKDYYTSIKYLQIALKQFKAISADQYIASTQFQMANNYIAVNNLDSALILYSKAKEYYETTDNLPVLAYIQGNIGVIQKRQNKLDSARVNLSFAVKFLEEKKDIQALIPYYIHASENEMLAGRMDIALNYAQKAVESAIKEESPIRKRDAYAQLMSVYAAMGEYHLAYDYQNKYLHLRDSIINIETITQMANMRADFEVAQKQNELDRMEASRRLMHIILWLTIISFVVVVFLLAVVYRNGKRRKAMNKELLQKQQALKASKKELEQVNASKDRLFSIISHDLRSPVATMSGLSDILKQYLDNNQIDEARELNKSIYDTLESIEFMLNNLLHWSVNQQNILNTNKEIFDLIPFASKLTKAYNQTAIIKQIDLRFETELQTFVIESDINSWGIVIRNLVNNALKFTKPGGQVVVGISIQENSAALDVTDNGVGMDAEQLGSLFKLTEQKPSWGTRNEKGQGLGLILTNEFVSRNNGYINVTSEPDKGTHFKIIIPVAIHHVQTVSESYTIPAEHSVPQTKAGTQSTLLP